MLKPKAKRLTKTYIDSITKCESPVDYPDATLAGFMVRCHPTGRKVYYYRYRISGVGKFLLLGSTAEISLSDARNLAKDAAGLVRNGICPLSQRKEVAEESRKLRLNTLERYVDGPFSTKALLRSSGRGHEAVNMVKSEYKQWLKLPINSITTDMLLKHRRDRLASGIKQNSIRRAEQELRSIVRMAVTDGTIESNALATLPPLAETEGRVRYLEQDEEHRLRTALLLRDHTGTAGRRKSIHRWSVPQCLDEPYTDHLTPAVLLSLNTGMRAGEMRQLLWSDVANDFSQIRLRAAMTKTRKGRTIPLNREARAVLMKLRMQSDCGWLFPNRKNDGPLSGFGKRSWKSLLGAAAITDLTWHDLRHAFASQLVMRRVPIIEVQQLLGHSDLRMTLRYAHLAPSALADAVSALDNEPWQQAAC